MIWYHLIFSDNKKAVGYAWNLMGFVAKLAQGVSSIGMDYLVKLIFCPPAWTAYVVINKRLIKRLICDSSIFPSKIDRDAPRMKCIPEEDEKRRSVFWELLNMDCRMVCFF